MAKPKAVVSEPIAQTESCTLAVLCGLPVALTVALIRFCAALQMVPQGIPGADKKPLSFKVGPKALKVPFGFSPTRLQPAHDALVMQALKAVRALGTDAQLPKAVHALAAELEARAWKARKSLQAQYMYCSLSWEDLDPAAIYGGTQKQFEEALALTQAVFTRTHKLAVYDPGQRYSPTSTAGFWTRMAKAIMYSPKPKGKPSTGKPTSKPKAKAPKAKDPKAAKAPVKAPKAKTPKAKS